MYTNTRPLPHTRCVAPRVLTVPIFPLAHIIAAGDQVGRNPVRETPNDRVERQQSVHPEEFLVRVLEESVSIAGQGLLSERDAGELREEANARKVSRHRLLIIRYYRIVNAAYNNIFIHCFAADVLVNIRVRITNSRTPHVLGRPSLPTPSRLRWTRRQQSCFKQIQCGYRFDVTTISILDEMPAQSADSRCSNRVRLQSVHFVL